MLQETHVSRTNRISYIETKKGLKMSKTTTFWLFCFALVHQISSQSEIKFKVEAKSGCNCKVITECNPLNELAQAQKFDELKSKHKSCGFDRKIPKFCCPPALFNEKTTTEDPIEVTGRIKIKEDRLDEILVC